MKKIIKNMTENKSKVVSQKYIPITDTHHFRIYF